MIRPFMTLKKRVLKSGLRISELGIRNIYGGTTKKSQSEGKYLTCIMSL